MTTAHHLKIALKNIRPAIAREILVPSDIRLDRLHDVIQLAMGWEDCHLHEFSNGVRGLGELRFGPRGAEMDMGFGPPMRDESKATLLDLAPAKGDKFTYSYDFGDDWLHTIMVKAIGELRPADVPLPVCLKAAGACPPEDCGGPHGYVRFLEVLDDPKHPEYNDLRNWIGGDWDSEHYDIVWVNQSLAKLAASWNRSPKKRAARKTTTKKG